MTTSVVSIVYVNDAPAAARFYGGLLGRSPSFETPGYITFDLGPGGYAAGPASRTRETARRIIARRRER